MEGILNVNLTSAPQEPCAPGKVRTPTAIPGPAGWLTWRHLQQEALHGEEAPGGDAHAPVAARVLRSEVRHDEADHLALGIILHPVVWSCHPGPAEVDFTLLVPDLAPNFGFDLVPAALVGALHGERLPSTTMDSPVRAQGRRTWGDRTC